MQPAGSSRQPAGINATDSSGHLPFYETLNDIDEAAREIDDQIVLGWSSKDALRRVNLALHTGRQREESGDIPRALFWYLRAVAIFCVIEEFCQSHPTRSRSASSLERRQQKLDLFNDDVNEATEHIKRLKRFVKTRRSEMLPSRRPPNPNVLHHSPGTSGTLQTPAQTSTQSRSSGIPTAPSAQVLGHPLQHSTPPRPVDSFQHSLHPPAMKKPANKPVILKSRPRAEESMQDAEPPYRAYPPQTHHRGGSLSRPSHGSDSLRPPDSRHIPPDPRYAPPASNRLPPVASSSRLTRDPPVSRPPISHPTPPPAELPVTIFHLAPDKAGRIERWAMTIQHRGRDVIESAASPPMSVALALQDEVEGERTEMAAVPEHMPFAVAGRVREWEADGEQGYERESVRRNESHRQRERERGRDAPRQHDHDAYLQHQYDQEDPTFVRRGPSELQRRTTTDGGPHAPDRTLAAPAHPSHLRNASLPHMSHSSSRFRHDNMNAPVQVYSSSPSNGSVELPSSYLPKQDKGPAIDTSPASTVVALENLGSRQERASRDGPWAYSSGSSSSSQEHTQERKSVPNVRVPSHGGLFVTNPDLLNAEQHIVPERGPSLGTSLYRPAEPILPLPAPRFAPHRAKATTPSPPPPRANPLPSPALPITLTRKEPASIHIEETPSSSIPIKGLLARTRFEGRVPHLPGAVLLKGRPPRPRQPSPSSSSEPSPTPALVPKQPPQTPVHVEEKPVQPRRPIIIRSKPLLFTSSARRHQPSHSLSPTSPVPSVTIPVQGTVPVRITPAQVRIAERPAQRHVPVLLKAKPAPSPLASRPLARPRQPSTSSSSDDIPAHSSRPFNEQPSPQLIETTHPPYQVSPPSADIPCTASSGIVSGDVDVTIAVPIATTLAPRQSSPTSSSTSSSAPRSFSKDSPASEKQSGIDPVVTLPSRFPGAGVDAVRGDDLSQGPVDQTPPVTHPPHSFSLLRNPSGPPPADSLFSGFKSYLANTPVPPRIAIDDGVGLPSQSKQEMEDDDEASVSSSFSGLTTRRGSLASDDDDQEFEDVPERASVEGRDGTSFEEIKQRSEDVGGGLISFEKVSGSSIGDAGWRGRSNPVFIRGRVFGIPIQAPNRERSTNSDEPPARSPMRLSPSMLSKQIQPHTSMLPAPSRNSLEAILAYEDDTDDNEGSYHSAQHELLAECPVCCMDLPLSHFPFASLTPRCVHEDDMTICKECVSMYVEAEIKSGNLRDENAGEEGRSGAAAATAGPVVHSGIPCPISSCKAVMGYNEIRMWAGTQAFSRYDNLLVRQQIQHETNFRWCKSPKCDSGQIHEQGERAPIVTCSECKARSCFTHDVAWHDGFTCVEYDKQAAERRKNDPDEASRLYIESITKQCPNCKRAIQKQGGCQHMTCRLPGGCGYEFCWLCSESHLVILKEGNHRHKPDCPLYFPVSGGVVWGYIHRILYY